MGTLKSEETVQHGERSINLCSSDQFFLSLARSASLDDSKRCLRHRCNPITLTMSCSWAAPNPTGRRL